ncbi:MAG: hypothetical protein H6982_03365 [Chromatiales bacterium]|nr:hypothetical protein [Chromatiales bacterium]
MEFEAAPDERSYALIANFEGGFAKGWRMAVPEAYKDALDIKLTPRTTAGKTTMLWTQGRGYAFQSGDIIHNCQEAYGEWGKALEKLELSVQVLDAKSGGYVLSETIETTLSELEIERRREKGGPKREVVERITIKRLRLDRGYVQFQVFRPAKDRSKLELAELYQCTQEDFVAFLQTGRVRTTQNKMIDVFAPAA